MGRRGRPAVLTPKERAEHRKQTLKKYRESHKEEVKTEIFALYKGDDFVDIGTVKELSVKYDINYHYLRRLLRPSIRKHQAVTQRSRGYILIEA